MAKRSPQKKRKRTTSRKPDEVASVRFPEAPSPRPSDSLPARALPPRLLGLVFLVTLVVRIAYLATADGPSFHDPLIDGDYYDYLGARLASGQGFDPGPFWQPPLYPLLLGGLYALLGQDLLWPRLFQALCDATTAALVTHIAFSLIGRRGWAIGAGIIVALHGSLVFYSGELLPTSVAVAAGTLAIWLGISPKLSMRRAALCGASIGIASLAVATSLVLVIPLAWLSARVQRRLGWVVLGVALAFVSAAAVSNHARSGDWIAISANGGVNLYIGNADDTDRLAAVRPGAAWESLINEPADKGITSPSGQDGYFVRKAVRWCIERPHRCAYGFVRKARLLLRSKEIPRNESLDVVKTQSPVLRVLLARLGSVALPYALLLPLAAAGMMAAYRHRQRASTLIAWTTLALSSMPVLFFVTGRYRTALVPGLAVLAVLGAHTLWTQRRNAWREALAGVCVLGLAVWPAPLPVDDVPYEAEMHYVVGGRRARLGDDTAAITSWKRALALRPDYLEAQFNLGLAYMRGERWSEAASAFRAVLELAPDEERARILLSECERRIPKG